MIMETAQSHVQKGLFTKQLLERTKRFENKQVDLELPKGELMLDDVNNPISINGHLLKGLVIVKR